jgi:taurine-pyruvate aminotransferase
VKNRKTKEPVDEATAQAVVSTCMTNDAVIIGCTNRSLHGFNNTLTFSPALIAKKDDIDEIITSVDAALTKVASA